MPPPAATDPDGRDADDPTGASQARRGFLLITGAKVWFLVCGTVLNIGLPRLLGDPARFGDYGVVNSFVTVLNMMMVTSALQAVSKRTSEAPTAAGHALRRGLRVTGALGALATLLVVALADPIASGVFHDPSLAPALRVAAAIPFLYALYGAHVGFLNGSRRFRDQAALDMGFSTLKLLFVAGFVVAGFEVVGAFAGFVLAAAAVTVAAATLTGPARRRAPTGPPVPYGAFVASVLGTSLLVNLLLQADVLALKSATFDPVRAQLAAPAPQAGFAFLAGATGLPASALELHLATEVTSSLSGLYRATKNLALVSYQGVVAITFVVFPLLSRATFAADTGATRRTIRQTARLALLLVTFLSVGLAAAGEPLAVFLFGEAYRLATVALLPLLAAMACFALFSVTSTLLTAGGHPRDALALSAFTLALQLGLLVAAARTLAPGAEVLAGASWATCAATAAGLAATAFVSYRRFGATLPLASVVRTAASAALALAGAAALPDAVAGPDGGLLAIFVRAGVAGIILLASLALLREVTRADLRALRRRKGPKP